MVHQNNTLFAHGPARFEAGTPPIQAAYGWATAIEYLNRHSFYRENRYLRQLTDYAVEMFKNISGYRVLFLDSNDRLPVFSFVHDRIHPHDLATYLDHLYGIASRAGHHCTMPLMESLELPGTLRLSFTWYNTKDEINKCVKALEQATGFFNV